MLALKEAESKNIACENIRFSSLFADRDVSRGGTTSPAAKSEEKRMFSKATKNTTNSLLINEHRASKGIIRNRLYHFLRRSSVQCNLTKKVIKSIQRSVSPSKFWTLIYLRLRNATDSCFRDYYYGKNKEKRRRFCDSCRNISV